MPYDNSQVLVDYSPSYGTPENKEPAATLENLAPFFFPVEDCIMSLDCSCDCGYEDPYGAPE